MLHTTQSLAKASLLCLVLSCMTPLACSSSEKKIENPSQKDEDKAPSQKRSTVTYDVDATLSVSDEIEAAIDKASRDLTQEAIEDLKKITEKSPKAFLAFHNLAILYEQANELEKAKMAYADTLNAEPNYTPALVNLIRIYVREGKASQALSEAEKYIAQNPKNFEHHFAKLEALLALDRHQELSDEVRRLLKQDEANPRLRYYLALSEFNRKHLRLAEFILDEALSIEAQDAEALYLRARLYDALKAEDVSLAPKIAETLDQVLRVDPYHSEALWMRGIIYYEANDLKNAENFFRRVMSLNPKLAEAYINLGNTLKTQNRGPEAENILKEAKALAPEDGLVDFALGTLYLSIEVINMPHLKDMDRLKMARQNFEDASKHWKNQDDIALAKRYIKTTDEAIVTLQTMLEAEALFKGPEEQSPENNASSFNVDEQPATQTVD